MDVNVRFTGIDSFEFTDEVAVFDLLGMQLVHGWLVDPQVPPLAALLFNATSVNSTFRLLILCRRGFASRHSS